ncbi:inner membrane protein [Anaerohalosphaera lusitana]|uniref:UPF0056 membrane protein n=1 Tax=Anaerohalosphaera lusitana TaxID=1936003 RepID=A0A1U9NHN5_9BACT|nr:MarC family protein [Anaerohalosphaera lusitana]AQT67268.1 inner membrane protein [Anaerohalosphaera lusitana]
MPYLEALVALFAIVDPIGNIPMFLHVADNVPEGQEAKAFNTAVLVGLTVLLVFAFAGKAILNHVFHIELAALQVAGGLLLIITAVDHLIFGILKKGVAINKSAVSATELGCVPLACPLLAGPGAMVTSLTMLEKHGPLAVIPAIVTIFLGLWLLLRFLEPVHRFLGDLVSTAFSKIMLVFISAIGVHMMITGLKAYFTTPS